MARDVEKELDAIFAHHNARLAEARSAAADRSATAESFGPAAAACLAEVVAPALRRMAQTLNERGVAARVPEADELRIEIPVSRHVRLGHGFGGYPYLRARADRQTRRIHFERNTADSRGGSAVGDYAVGEVNAELVMSLVLDLVRVLYGPP